MDVSIIAALKEVPLFVGLEDDLLLTLVKHGRRRRFPPGKPLFYEDGFGDALYIILSGDVSIQKPMPSGEVLHLAMRKQGEHFGEMALFGGRRRMADAVTATDCDLLVLDRDAFLRSIAECPQIALNIIVSLSDRLDQAAAHLQNHQELDVMGRVCAVLLELLDAHGIPDLKGGRRIGVKWTQQQLAERISARRESVTRAFASLKESHIIRLDGRAIIVLDEKELRRRSDLY